jgi:beta-phosphoglucomutase
MIKLVIFDLDGVLTSTSNEHFAAWKKIIWKYYKMNIPDEVEKYTKGVSRTQSLKNIAYHLKIELSDSDIIKLSAEKNDLYISMVSNYTNENLFPSVIQLFNYLKEQNIKIALGSASKNGPLILSRLQITNHFDYIVDPSVCKSKPAPDIFLNAMNHFGYLPQECIGIEDSQAGIDAINGAGMISIGIIADGNLLHCNYTFHDVSSINLQIFTQKGD